MADWETAATEALARLTEPHLSKKRATIIALVDARLTGVSEETVWKRPDTCSRNIYHSRWKRDPVFFEVLETVTGLARKWQDSRGARALASAAERLALASPVAVARLIEKLQSADEAIVLRAAMGILDRAGVDTAVKSKSEVANTHSLDADQFAALSAAAKTKAAAVEAAAATAWGPERKPEG